MAYAVTIPIGPRLLVVEDDAKAAAEIVGMAQSAGWDMIEVARSFAEVAAAMRTGYFKGAIVGWQLGDDTARTIVSALVRSKARVVIYSDAPTKHWVGTPVILKDNAGELRGWLLGVAQDFGAYCTNPDACAFKVPKEDKGS